MDIHAFKISRRGYVSLPDAEMKERVRSMVMCALDLLDEVVFSMKHGVLPATNNDEVKCMVLGVMLVAFKQAGTDFLSDQGKSMVRYFGRLLPGKCSIADLLAWEIEILFTTQFGGCRMYDESRFAQPVLSPAFGHHRMME